MFENKEHKLYYTFSIISLWLKHIYSRNWACLSHEAKVCIYLVRSTRAELLHVYAITDPLQSLNNFVGSTINLAQLTVTFKVGIFTNQKYT